MQPRSAGQKKFTGWHMTAVMAAFFATFITANLTLVYFASSSWTGLIAENGYVASQDFSRRAAQLAAQDRLGWKSHLVVQEGALAFSLVDDSGRPINASSVTAYLGRPTHDGEDQTVALLRSGGGDYTADPALASGHWLITIEARTTSGQTYRKGFRVTNRKPRT